MAPARAGALPGQSIRFGGRSGREYVPADRVSAVDGLTVPHESRKAAGDGQAATSTAARQARG
jgi:hypothetical protein